MNNYSESSQQEYSQQQRSVKENRVFVYNSFNINYENTSQISQVPQDADKDVRVKNYLCVQEGNSLYKTTEIYFENKMVKIDDKFEVDIRNLDDLLEHDLPKNISARCSDKVRIFHHDSIQKLQKGCKSDKKDKKNIVKNIVKIFISWVEKKKHDKKTDQYIDTDIELKKLIQRENFNNRLIKELVSNERINKVFLKFLIDDAEEEIKYSRIHDKDSHYEALELYKKLLEKSCTRSQNNILRKQQKMDSPAEQPIAVEAKIEAEEQ